VEALSVHSSALRKLQAEVSGSRFPPDSSPAKLYIDESCKGLSSSSTPAKFKCRTGFSAYLLYLYAKKEKKMVQFYCMEKNKKKPTNKKWYGKKLEKKMLLDEDGALSPCRGLGIYFSVPHFS
jgi:hypothetical protein